MANNLSSFPKVYLDIMHDLMIHAASNNAQTTVEGLKNLYFQRKAIAEIESENARNNEIFKVTHLEVDPGFVVAKTKDARLKEINEKLQLLIDSYVDAKESNYLENYFLSAFESDACFNHRLKHLKSFYEQHKGQTVKK